MSEIGLRAAEAIRTMAKENETTSAFELDCLSITPSSLYQYQHCISAPSAVVLANMAKSGYDVLYILTGERK